MNIQQTVREEVAKRISLRERLERDEVLTPEEWVVAKEYDWAEEGARYRTKRLAAGFTIAEAARQTGFSASTLSKFETGQPVQRANVIERSYRLLIERDIAVSLADTLIAAYKEATGIDFIAEFYAEAKAARI